MSILLPSEVNYICEEQETGKVVYTFKHNSLGALGSFYLTPGVRVLMAVRYTGSPLALKTRFPHSNSRPILLQEF